LASAAGAPGPDAQMMTTLRTALASANAAHELDGCDCKGNGRRKIEPLLSMIAAAPASERLEATNDIMAVWRHTSRLDHHAGFERMTRTDGARIWIGPAEPWQRVRTFVSLVKLYGCIVGWTAELFSREVAEDLMRQFGALTQAPVLLEVASRHPEAFTIRSDRPSDD
jgi:hypothetical protein